jgi:hypothetical protein
VLTITDIDALLSRALVQVATGKMEPGIANAMAGLARALITVKESGEVSQQIAGLQEAVAAINQGGRRVA